VLGLIVGGTLGDLDGASVGGVVGSMVGAGIVGVKVGADTVGDWLGVEYVGAVDGAVVGSGVQIKIVSGSLPESTRELSVTSETSR
jgi:hypothetical protein